MPGALACRTGGSLRHCCRHRRRHHHRSWQARMAHRVHHCALPAPSRGYHGGETSPPIPRACRGRSGPVAHHVDGAVADQLVEPTPTVSPRTPVGTRELVGGHGLLAVHAAPPGVEEVLRLLAVLGGFSSGCPVGRGDDLGRGAITLFKRIPRTRSSGNFSSPGERLVRPCPQVP